MQAFGKVFKIILTSRSETTRPFETLMAVSKRLLKNRKGLHEVGLRFNLPIVQPDVAPHQVDPSSHIQYRSVTS